VSEISRRDLLAGITGVAAAMSVGPVTLPAIAPEFPRKADFLIPDGLTYVNSAYTHPMPKAGVLVEDSFRKTAGASPLSASEMS